MRTRETEDQPRTKGIVVTDDAIVITGTLKRELDAVAEAYGRSTRREVAFMVDQWLIAFQEGERLEEEMRAAAATRALRA